MEKSGKLSIDNQIFGRMRGDIDSSLNELIGTMLGMGQTSGRLNLRLDINLGCHTEAVADEYGEIQEPAACLPGFDYKITTKSETTGKNGGRIPVASSRLRIGKNGMLTLEEN